MATKEEQKEIKIMVIKMILMWTSQEVPVSDFDEKTHQSFGYPLQTFAGSVSGVIRCPCFAVYNVHPRFCVHYTQDYYTHGM